MARLASVTVAVCLLAAALAAPLAEDAPMTTVDPIDTETEQPALSAADLETDACANITSCHECHNVENCAFASCDSEGSGPVCMPAVGVAETCTVVTDCSAFTTTTSTTTLAPNATTTTSKPTTTTPAPDTTTTPAPDTTTTPAPDTTTTTAPDTTTTPAPDTTTTPAPDTTTPAPTTTSTAAPTTTGAPDTTTAVPTPSPKTTTTTPAPPHPASGGFSVGSFFGGIILTLVLAALAYAGLRYYRYRFDGRYRTL